MAEASSVGYRVLGTIKAVKGYCHAGHQTGDEMRTQRASRWRALWIPAPSSLPVHHHAPIWWWISIGVGKSGRC